MPAESDAQAQLVAWIWGQPGASPPPGLRALGALGTPSGSLDQGLSAYREHAKALAVRALASHCPRLAAWLGDAEFAGLAWALARAHPPRQGDMNRWGRELPAFLDSLPGMEPEPPALARLDLALHELLGQADAPAPDTTLWQALQTLPADALRLALNGALLSLPAGLQAALDDAEPLDWPTPPGAQVWVWRRGWRPCWTWLADDLASWLQALEQAPHLAGAIERTLTRHPGFDLGLALQRAWSQGWLQGVQRL